MSSTIRKQRVEHGMSRHPLYPKWQDMVRRCHNPNHQRYSWYDAKGASVCQQWRDDPVAFIDWCLAQGWQPGMEIDKDLKIPGNLIYSPATCSIVTHRQNMLGVVSRSSGRLSSKLKLTVQDAAAIVRRKDNGEKSRYLAEEYGVHVATINHIYKKRA